MSLRRVIGFDAGGTKLLGGVVDGGLAVRHRVHRVWPGSERDGLLDLMVEAVEEAREAAPDVDAVGFGIPSLVDWETGVSLFSVHLPLEDVPFRAFMEERLDLPVFVDNDANLALLAEARAGAARGASDALMLTLGTGIGGGILAGGELERGSRGAGAELGHIVVDVDGPPCPGKCPGRGCLEALASGPAPATEARRGGAPGPSFRRASGGASLPPLGREGGAPPARALDDVTPRVLEALRAADVVACEDRRHTRVLLDRYGIRAAALVSYHEHNERARAAELAARVADGAVVALVSDAGMPAVSDPGWVVVRACAEAGLRVEVLPGPSAVDVALVASALPAERWMFVGFLPRRAAELRAVWDVAVT